MFYKNRQANFVFIIVVAFMIAFVPLVTERIERTDWYRTLTRYDAFYDVAVTSVRVSPMRRIVVEGEFKKRRCDFVRNNYYIRDVSGLLIPASNFESLVPDRERNRLRPASPEAQQFGPWRITSGIDTPTGLVIYTTMECPEGTFAQKLLDVEWKDFERAE